jgi:hypothetical protein
VRLLLAMMAEGNADAVRREGVSGSARGILFPMSSEHGPQLIDLQGGLHETVVPGDAAPCRAGRAGDGCGAADCAARGASPHDLPDGFRARLFAGEPDVVQPIAFTFDDRGRMWVVECLSYPNWTDKPEGGDRVTIYQDADGDGTFDKRTVFWDKGRNLSVSPWASGASGCARRRSWSSFPTATAMTGPMVHRRCFSTAGTSRPATTSSATWPGGPTAGSTAATAFSAIRCWAGRARRRPSGPR